MIDFGVGVMHNTINSRFGPKPLVHADYMTGLACGADSFWVADHLNSALPPSMWTPKHVGAAKLIPKMDAHLEPWTMLGYLAARNKLGRMRLGVAVTDTGRRNPAVTAQAAASLHLLTRGRAVLGIGTGERESNAPYGVDWSKPVARFEEAVATIRALWDSNGELVTRDSPFFPLHKAPFALPPWMTRVGLQDGRAEFNRRGGATGDGDGGRRIAATLLAYHSELKPSCSARSACSTILSVDEPPPVKPIRMDPRMSSCRTSMTLMITQNSA